MHRRRELIFSTKHTLHRGFSNCSTPTPNGSPNIVYWYKALVNKAANVILTYIRATIVAGE